MYGYIYLIVNKIDGKTYVGKHKLYDKKWDEDNYMGSGIKLKPAQEKYGIENFEKFLIAWTSSEEDACEKEKFWIAEYRRRGKERPYVWIDTTPNEKGLYDCFVFNAPLLNRVSISAIFKDLR